MASGPAVSDFDLIDSHAHLDGPDFDADRAEVLARARAAGVRKMICVGSGADLATAERAVALAEQEPDIWATVGIHPHDVARMEPGWWQAIADLAARPRVVGVGETGLDFHYNHSPHDIQREAFARFIEMGRAAGKPIVCHIRDAHEEARTILRDGGAAAVGGVIHCFTGTPEDAEAYVAMGFHISFSGIVTFRGKSAEPIRQAVKKVPLDRILIETDCPFLAPMPMRGKRNEPAYVVHTAGVVAEQAGVSLADLAAASTRNATSLFALT
jgi:TatD DNase family protein